MMWKNILLFLVFAYCVLCAVPAAGAEQSYLIRESELQSIEAYKKNSEQEKQIWLSQVRSLKADSENSNAQLRHQREVNQKLTLSFNEYEADRLTQLSLKNGEIAAKDQEIAELKLDKKSSDGQRNVAIVIAGALALALAAKFLKIIP
jgi:23S rRNA pseudoU1915 N3-methylase RlmH